MLVVDKPRVTGSPPQLPPFLQRGRGGPERRTIILPDLFRVESATDLRDFDNNWITTVYQWMNRVVGDSLFAPDSRWETAHISMRRYRQWLDTYETKNGLPPHISFGGAIEAGEGDPTFYPRWLAYAREMFV